MNKFKKYFDNDNYQNGLRVVIICALAVVLVVGVNLFSSVIPTKIANYDISTEKVFSISNETEAALKELDEPVQLLYVCEKGSEYKNTQVMLNLYADASDNITVEQVDPAFDPQTIIKYTGDVSLDNNSVIVASKDKKQIVYYSDYYTAGVFVLEDYLNSAIDYVTSDELRVVYTLQGHNEMPIHTSTSAYMGLDGFELKELTLMDEGKVPDDCRVLIINGINQDITSKEADLIIDYLKKGGSLLLTTDYTKSLMKNLDKVTQYFEATTGDGLIMESDQNRFLDDNQAYVVPSLYTGTSMLADGVSYMMLPNLKPIVVDEDNLDPSIKFTKVLEASEKAYAVFTNIFTGQAESNPGPFTVGAIFEKGEDGGEGKMIWVSSRHLANIDVSEEVGGGNITFFLNSICYLGEDDPVASIHGKKISTQFLEFTDAQLKMWEIIIPAVIPALALIIGVIVVIRRKRR